MNHRSSVTRMLEKYAIQAGLESVNSHALRHTFATRYLNANPDDLRGLARLLGHASLNTVVVYLRRKMPFSKAVVTAAVRSLTPSLP